MSVRPAMFGGGGGGGGASALDDLTDVTITSVAASQFLRYSGSAWVNVTDVLPADGGKHGWASDTDTYIERNAADTIALVTGGTARALVSSTGIDLEATGRYGFGSTDTNTYITRGGADDIRVVAGGSGGTYELRFFKDSSGPMLQLRDSSGNSANFQKRDNGSGGYATLTVDDQFVLRAQRAKSPTFAFTDTEGFAAIFLLQGATTTDSRYSSTIGRVRVGDSGDYATLSVLQTATTAVTQANRLASSGTGDLWQGQNNAGTVLARITSAGYIAANVGAVTTPGFYFEGDANTGIYSSAADSINITAGGTLRIQANGTGLGFFTATPVAKPTALTAADASAINSGDATTDAVIANIRTRVNELETKIQSLGLLS